jgi:hypothetical protein
MAGSTYNHPNPVKSPVLQGDFTKMYFFQELNQVWWLNRKYCFK